MKEETRPVLQRADAAPARVHASVPVAVEAGSRLEFSYGVTSASRPALPVSFVVTAQTAGGERRLFEASVADAAAADTWHDAAVELAGISGPVTLTFSTSAQQGAAAQPVTAYFADPTLTTAARHGDTPPPRNLILISLDTLAAGHMGTYGYARDTTPQTDRRFSSEGVIVDRFFTTAPNTLDAHATMMTGQLPAAVLAPTADSRAIADHVVTLADELRAKGYQTAAFTENAYVSRAFGFWRGFATFGEELGVAGSKETPGLITETFESTRAWVKAHANEPFFVFVHTYQVHTPYSPPTEYGSLFPVSANASERETDIALYDREIRYTDAMLAGLLDDFEAMGVLEHSLLVVTSDHGEEFGEHGRRYHGTTLHDETLKVPLLLRAPGLLPAGVRRSGPMSMADLFPTLGQLLDFQWDGQIDGSGLAEHLRSGSPVEMQPIFHEAGVTFAAVYADSSKDARAEPAKKDAQAVPAADAWKDPLAVTPMDEQWIPPSFGVTAWPLRVIRIRTAQGARYEAYDLEHDPSESHNIYREDDPVLERLRVRLDEYQATQERRRTERAAASLLRPGAGDNDEPIGDEHREKLRALGYLQ